MTRVLSDLEWLQSFYSSLCDGDWEHSYGFKIDNIDNPGWSVEFDLSNTALSDSVFTEVTIERTDIDWVRCEVKDQKFIGYCGASNLVEMFSIFRKWVGATLVT